MHRRSVLPTNQYLTHSANHSANHSRQRRSSAMSNVSPSFIYSLSEGVFDDKSQEDNMIEIKRSKLANMILINRDSEFPAQADPSISPDRSVPIENSSSGDDTRAIRPNELAKTKSSRAQTEYRRRVELNESFERLRL